MKKRLCVLAELSPATAERLEAAFDIVHRRSPENAKAATTEEGLASILSACRPDAAAIEAQPFTAKALESSGTLKMIASVRTTPSNVDMAAAARLGISVSNAPGRNAVAVAEFALALILSAARNIPAAYRAVKGGKYLIPPGTPTNENLEDIIWSNPALKGRPYADFRGKELKDSTLGLFGFGQIGRMVAERAKAFGMRVIAYDPFVDPAAIAALGCEGVSFDELLRNSDFVSLHAKAAAGSKGAFDYSAFKRMKPSAYLVNTARGALIDQADLARALREGLLAGAALDVFEREPLREDDELLALDTLIITPHIGGATADVVRHQSALVERNLSAWLRGEPLPDAWGRK